MYLSCCLKLYAKPGNIKLYLNTSLKKDIARRQFRL